MLALPVRQKLETERMINSTNDYANLNKMTAESKKTEKSTI